MTLSNAISAVSLAFQPSLSSLVDEIPGVFLSTKKILIPLAPFSNISLGSNY